MAENEHTVDGGRKLAMLFLLVAAVLSAIRPTAGHLAGRGDNSRGQLLEERGDSTMAKAKPIPDGYHSVTPYLVVKGAAAAIDFYKKAFGATELVRMPMPGGKIGHAEIKIGNSPVMLADESPEMGAVAPQAAGSPVG